MYFTLWVSISFGLSMVYGSELPSLCNLSSQHIQAATPIGSTLYLIANDQLYRIPLTSNHINNYPSNTTPPLSKNPQIALFNQAPGLSNAESQGQVEHLGSWMTSQLLGGAQIQGLVHNQTLLQLNLITTSESHSNSTDNNGDGDSRHLVHVILGDSWVLTGTPSHILFNPKTGKEYPSTALKPYSLITNGGRDRGLVIGAGTTKFCQITLVNPISFKTLESLENFKSYDAYLSKNLNSVLLKEPESQEPPQGFSPLISGFPVFGFIYEDVIHLWDVSQKRVIIFKFPDTFGSEFRAQVMSMDHYFVCSEHDWTSQDSNPSNWLQITLWVVLGIAGIGAAVWVTLATIKYLSARRKRTGRARRRRVRARTTKPSLGKSKSESIKEEESLGALQIVRTRPFPRSRLLSQARSGSPKSSESIDSNKLAIKTAPASYTTTVNITSSKVAKSSIQQESSIRSEIDSLSELKSQIKSTKPFNLGDSKINSKVIKNPTKSRIKNSKPVDRS